MQTYIIAIHATPSSALYKHCHRKSIAHILSRLVEQCSDLSLCFIQKRRYGQTEQSLDHSFQQILQRAAAPFVLRRFRSLASSLHPAILHLLSPFSSHLICCFQCRANRVLFCGCCFSFLSLSSFIPILLGKSPTAPPLSVLASSSSSSSWSRSIATFGDICSLRPHQQLSPARPLSPQNGAHITRDIGREMKEGQIWNRRRRRYLDSPSLSLVV